MTSIQRKIIDHRNPKQYQGNNNIIHAKKYQIFQHYFQKSIMPKDNFSPQAKEKECVNAEAEKMACLIKQTELLEIFYNKVGVGSLRMN